MSEITVRAWDDEGKRFYYFTIGQGSGIFTVNGLYNQLCLEGAHFEQSTGLPDAMGVTIFEGDIIKHHERVEIVIFKNGGFAPFSIAGWECTTDWEYCEVIGNIHENPELLEKAEVDA